MATSTSAGVIEEAQRLAGQFAERAAGHDRDASFPFENFEALRAAGLLNLTMPREQGGHGAGLEVACRVLQTVAGGDASTALVLAWQYIHHANIARNRRWPHEVYARVCRESLEGIALINTARVEPELGTSSRGGLPATIARRTSEGWSINGHKTYVTGSPILRFFQVTARTDEDPPRVGNFLVPSDTPGLSFRQTWDHLGMRATGSDDLILEDVCVPLDYAVDVRPAGEQAPEPEGAVWNALALSALYHGIAVAARDWLVDYLGKRTPTNLGAPLATLPRFQAIAGEVEALLLVSEQLIYGLAREAERDGVTPQLVREANLAKYVATNNSVRAVRLGMESIGNPGLSRHHPIERHYRDVLCSRIHTPQDDVVLATAGRAALGIPTPPPGAKG